MGGIVSTAMCRLSVFQSYSSVFQSVFLSYRSCSIGLKSIQLAVPSYAVLFPFQACSDTRWAVWGMLLSCIKRLSGCCVRYNMRSDYLDCLHLGWQNDILYNVKAHTYICTDSAPFHNSSLPGVGCFSLRTWSYFEWPFSSVHENIGC